MRKLGLLVVIVVIGCCWFGLQEAQTTPDLAARYAKNCDTACHSFMGDLPQWAPKTACSLSCQGCHISPNGSGIRNDAGFKVGKEALPMKSFITEDERVEELDPKLGDYFRYGLDLRMLYLAEEIDDSISTEQDFQDSRFLMEGYAYFEVEPFRYLSLVMMQDFKNDFGQYFALLKNLPLNGHVMVGRFDLPYGLRVADHTSYVREKLGFGLRSMDDGIQIGFQPGRPFFSVAYTNGSLDAFPGAGPRGKALTVKGGYWHEHFSIGGNFYRNEDTDTKIYGGQGTATVWNFSYLAEVNFAERPNDIDAVAALHQLNFYPWNWVNFRLQYDFWDPDTNIRDDAEHRYSIGANLFPVPFVELELAYRIYDEKPDLDNNGLVFILHGYF